MAKHRTWDEWKAKGYHVMKGERSKRRNEAGVATFSRKQVEKNQPRSRGWAYPDKTYGFDWDSVEDEDRYGLGHDDW